MFTRNASTKDWVDRLNALHTPVLADVLDRLGRRQQTFKPGIGPLFPGARIAGVARTVQTVPVDGIPAEPYKGEMAAVDALESGDVMVVSHCEWSFWGELLSTAAKYRDCRGVVIDGYTRDTKAIIEMGFPVFCRGIHPADSLGRIDVVNHDLPIQCGGVQVQSGDLILADADGVVVIPVDLAEEAISLGEEKIRGENLVRKAREGMSVAEAFRVYGIL